MYLRGRWVVINMFMLKHCYFCKLLAYDELVMPCVGVLVQAEFSPVHNITCHHFDCLIVWTTSIYGLLGSLSLLRSLGLLLSLPDRCPFA
jgi:hypothetical protein